MHTSRFDEERVVAAAVISGSSMIIIIITVVARRSRRRCCASLSCFCFSCRHLPLCFPYSLSCSSLSLPLLSHAVSSSCEEAVAVAAVDDCDHHGADFPLQTLPFRSSSLAFLSLSLFLSPSFLVVDHASASSCIISKRSLLLPLRLLLLPCSSPTHTHTPRVWRESQFAAEAGRIAWRESE